MKISVGKLDKDSLRREFSRNPNEYYKVELFDREGFKRHNCKVCGKNFWSAMDRDACEDSSHTEYSFFREKPRDISYVDFWKKFADFFKKNGHKEIQRYPVVSRWRKDLYFTIASIQDFQRIENGVMAFEYGANPLVVPQICLRFSDIENVGVTGRHFTSFMMAGQHAFNYPKEGYFKDRTIELNYRFLTEVLGVKKDGLVYNEDVWAMGDFSEFGPSLESFANGAELVNSVFTQFEYVNGEIKELSAKVVDVGWGFERLMWFYSGHDTAFEAVFSGILKKLEKRINFEVDNKTFKKFSSSASELDITEKGGKAKEHALLKKAGITIDDYEKKIKPTQALYSVLDHTRTLLFAISDGALPSNIGGGYNLRVILRRALSFIEEYGFDFDLSEIAVLEAAELKPLFPELSDNLGLFARVIGIEEKRFAKTRENANRVIDGILAKGKKIDAGELRTLYESKGITPELIEAAASKRNVRIEMPEASYEDIVKGDFAAKEKAHRIDVNVSGAEKTEPLYYKLAESSESKILLAEKNYVVLDKTPFYPEGGGQEADHGEINGHKVVDVQKVGNVIVHVMHDDVHEHKDLQKGKAARCVVDKERRRRLMVHHTATHLMSAASRNVLGKHAWQEGTRKEFEKAHIDISHYDRLNDTEIMELENFVNQKLFDGIRVTVKDVERGEAERRYGFEIYQGHGVPSHMIRLVLIEDKNGNFIDAEACGGLHVSGMEQAIGTIKIIDTERISDGVDRIEFVAGKAALDYFRREHNEIVAASGLLNSERFALGSKVAELRNQDKELNKKLEQYKELTAREIAESTKAEKTIEREVDVPKDVMRKAANLICAKHKASVVLLRNKANEAVCIAGDESKESALDFLKSRAKGRQFLGGGSKKYAEGIIK